MTGIEGRGIDIDALINQRRIGAMQYAVAVLGACALFVEGFDTSAIGYIQPQITREWSVPASTIGTILSADMLGLLVGYLFVAPLSARFGHKRMVIASTTFFGLMTFLTGDGCADAAGVPLLDRHCVGGAMPSAVALTGEYIPQRVRSTSVTLMYIGFRSSRSARNGVSLLLEAYSWRAVLAFGGASHCCSLCCVRAAGIGPVSDQSQQRQDACRRVLRRIAGCRYCNSSG
jgi:AAHS family 4-hydroxybenzoate transporter-like MFS transporter